MNKPTEKGGIASVIQSPMEKTKERERTPANRYIEALSAARSGRWPIQVRE